MPSDLEKIANGIIETITATVESNLTSDQKRTLLDKIAVASAGDIKAAAVREKYSRVAAASQDEHLLPVLKQTARNLAKIGLNLEEALEGGLTAVDLAIKASAMTIEQRMELKSSLRMLGVL
jgi:hypothetical protein